MRTDKCHVLVLRLLIQNIDHILLNAAESHILQWILISQWTICFTFNCFNFFMLFAFKAKSVKDCFWCNFSEVFFPHCNDILDSCRDLVYIWICVVMCHLGVTLQLQFLSSLYLLLFCSQSKLFPRWSDKVGIYNFNEITRIVISLKLATKLSKLSCNLI